MIYRCYDCGRHQLPAYDVKVRKPCECGSWRFWFLHFGIFGRASTEIALDCANDNNVIEEERPIDISDWSY